MLMYFKSSCLFLSFIHIYIGWFILFLLVHVIWICVSVSFVSRYTSEAYVIQMYVSQFVGYLFILFAISYG